MPGFSTSGVVARDVVPFQAGVFTLVLAEVTAGPHPNTGSPQLRLRFTVAGRDNVSVYDEWYLTPEALPYSVKKAEKVCQISVPAQDWPTYTAFGKWVGEHAKPVRAKCIPRVNGEGRTSSYGVVDAFVTQPEATPQAVTVTSAPAEGALDEEF